MGVHVALMVPGQEQGHCDVVSDHLGLVQQQH